MQIRPQGWLYLTAFAVLGAGCATTVTDDDDARSARLPTGVTLLESDRNECAGSVAIDESAVASAQRSDLVIQRGQNAMFEIDCRRRRMTTSRSSGPASARWTPTATRSSAPRRRRTCASRAERRATSSCSSATEIATTRATSRARR